MLGRCGARYERRNDQTPKASYSSSAQRSWFKESNGINGRGPSQGGKDAVYAGCELEPTQWSATGEEVLIGSFSIEFFFLFSLVLQFNFLASTNVCCPERELLVALGLSFYPLEQAPNIMIYAMSKSGGQQRAVSSKLRVLFTQAQGQTRAVAAKKFICPTSGSKLEVTSLCGLFLRGRSA